MGVVTLKRLFFGFGVLALVFLLLSHYKQRDSYRCQQCFSQRDVSQWRIGLWGMEGSIPLTPTWSRMHESQFRHDFFPANHAHDWRFAQGSPYYLFGTTWGGCAIGPGRHITHLYSMYESDPRFRVFIEARLADKSLTKTNLIAMVSLPANSDESPLQKDSEALLEQFYSR